MHTWCPSTPQATQTVGSLQSERECPSRQPASAGPGELLSLSRMEERCMKKTDQTLDRKRKGAARAAVEERARRGVQREYEERGGGGRVERRRRGKARRRSSESMVVVQKEGHVTVTHDTAITWADRVASRNAASSPLRIKLLKWGFFHPAIYEKYSLPKKVMISN
ncbi:hypothetical protein C8R44DRAFT_736201 [Mycena epipterygia]|nr:hypothetical protein C8R44DRAFT_736201 [Mycena epipterygia]